jgi:ATP-dependent helicase HrpA
VRHALVAGEADWTSLGARRAGFLRRNAELRERLEGIEQRIRRREVVAGDDTVAEFYRKRIPEDVRDVRAFAAWWRTASQTDPGMLDMTEEDLRATGATASERDFPAHWRQGDQVLSLRYRFDPGDPGDGVTAIVPISLLPRLSPAGFDWQVPGLRHELVTALLRSLPKALRRHVVPAADWAERITAEVRGSGPEDHVGLPETDLTAVLAERVRAAAHQPVTASDFDLTRVPEHLRVTFLVVDDAGEAIDSDRDLAALQERLRDTAQVSVARAITGAEDAGPAGLSGFAAASGLRAWTFGALPDTVETAVAGGVVRGYPALVDDGDSVALTVEPDAQRAAALTRNGVLRLLLLAVPSPAPWVLDHLTQQERLALAGSPHPDARAVIEDVRTALAGAAVAAAGPVRDPSAFERLRDAFAASITDDMVRTTALVARILLAARELDREIAARTSLALLAPLADVRAQLDALVFDGFVSRTGPAHLAHLPRYLAAAAERVRALPDNPGRDRQRMTEFEAAAALYRDAGGVLPPRGEEPAPLVHARWLLEEFRVSLFAQRLGTAEPVSLQRIAAAVRTARR